QNQRFTVGHERRAVHFQETPMARVIRNRRSRDPVRPGAVCPMTSTLRGGPARAGLQAHLEMQRVPSRTKLPRRESQGMQVERL
ncbi:MAG: hypothetical protein ACI9MC_004162, partial [Kiritimatiellia bacterium]